MWPALEPGDWVVAQRRRRVPGRGSVVVFASPHDSKLLLIKRVIGLPGESVTIAGGQVHVDGQTLPEPWAGGQTTPDSEDLVPDGAVWLLGDNRSRSSADSRTLGPVVIDQIGWRVIAIYWPQSRIGTV